MIGAILSVREQCASMGSHRPGKGGQVNFSADAGWMDQRLEQDIIFFQMGEVNWFVTNVGGGKFDPGW